MTPQELQRYNAFIKAGGSPAAIYEIFNQERAAAEQPLLVIPTGGPTPSPAPTPTPGGPTTPGGFTTRIRPDLTDPNRQYMDVYNPDGTFQKTLIQGRDPLAGLGEWKTIDEVAIPRQPTEQKWQALDTPEARFAARNAYQKQFEVDYFRQTGDWPTGKDLQDIRIRAEEQAGLRTTTKAGAEQSNLDFMNANPGLFASLTPEQKQRWILTGGLLSVGGGPTRDYAGEQAAQIAGQLAVQALQNQGQMDVATLNNEYNKAYHAALQQQAEAQAWSTREQKPYEFERTQDLAERQQGMSELDYMRKLASAPGDYLDYMALSRGQTPPGLTQGGQIFQGVNRVVPLPAGLMPGYMGMEPTQTGAPYAPQLPAPAGMTGPGANPFLSGYGGAPTERGLQPWEAPPPPSFMQNLMGGQPIGAPGLPPGTMRIPGLSQQANLNPSEAGLLRSTVQRQGVPGEDWDWQLARTRRSYQGIGPTPGYGGVGVRRPYGR